MSLKVALVGCGKMADSHCEEIARVSTGRLVAVCDAEPLMAEQLAVRFGIPSHFSDLDAMLSTVRPDVVHIVTPPQSHLALATRVAEAGCHVYVEKPITLNLADTRSLLDSVRRAGKKMTTGWRVNFDPPALALQEMVAEGAIGDPVHVETYFGYDLSGPYGPAILASKDHWVRKLPGQLFHNNIDHMLNKLPPFLGSQMPVIQAQARAFRGSGGENDLPDELRILLANSRVTAFGNFSANAKPAGHTLKVCGTKATLEVDYVGRTITFAAGPKMPSAIGRLRMAFSQGFQFYREGMRNVIRFAKSDYRFNSGLGLLFERFYDSIINDTPPPIAYDDMVWVTAVMEEVFRQTTAAEASARSLAC